MGRGESRGHQQHSKRAAAPSKAIGKGRRPEEPRSSSSSRTGERASHETQTAGKLTSTREANEGQSGGKGYDQQHAVTGSTPVAVEDEAVTVEAPVGEHSKGKR